MNNETVLPKTIQEEVNESALVGMVNLTISTKKENRPVFEKFGKNAYHPIKITANRKRKMGFGKSLLVSTGLAEKPIPDEVVVDAVVLDIADKELLLIYPPDDLEELFSNFLNDLEKKGWTVKVYEHVVKRGRLP